MGALCLTIFFLLFFVQCKIRNQDFRHFVFQVSNADAVDRKTFQLKHAEQYILNAFKKTIQLCNNLLKLMEPAL
jgi:hypothetical protein